MEIREYQLIDVDKIMINPENPRHNPVINLNETFIMQQLITSTREANAMYKLISDIYKDGWYAQSIITVIYDKERKKYIAWDGNRRTTALKILKYPQLIDAFTKFSYNQRRGIYNMSKGIKDQSFFQVPCYVASSFEDCSGYIKNIHTNDTGALRWDTASIKRFEERLGIKNIFTQLQGYCPKAFEKVGKEFPVSKFERIVSSKIGKEYLNIEFINNTLTCLSSIDELETKVAKIIEDINNNVITTETIKSNNNIKDYLYPNTKDDNSSKKISDIISIIQKDEVNTEKDEKFIQDNLFNDNDKKSNDKNPDMIKPQRYNEKLNELKDKVKNNSYSENNSQKLIRKNQDILFKNIDFSKVKEENERSLGIKNLCTEIRYLSSYNQYKRLPISYCFLIRSLLEQSTIYFLINKGKWEKLKEGNNNRDLRLEKIIEYISKNKENLINDDSIKRCWESCFNTEGTKNYLDLVIHHPYKVIANIEAIRSITEIGMYAIIQYLINS